MSPTLPTGRDAAYQRAITKAWNEHPDACQTCAGMSEGVMCAALEHQAARILAQEVADLRAKVDHAGRDVLRGLERDDSETEQRIHMKAAYHTLTGKTWEGY